MKDIYTCLVVFAISVIVAYNAQNKKMRLSGIAMENVEALAHDESYFEKIFYQNCDPCKTWDGGYKGVTFYCSVGVESCFSSSCIAGSCGGMR